MFGVTALLIAGALAFTGCSKTSSQSGSTSSGIKTSINLYSGGSDNVCQAWQAVIDNYNKKNIGITVNLQFVPSGGTASATDKLLAALKANQKSVDVDLQEVDENGLYTILKQGGEGALDTLNASKIPNMKNIVPKSSVSANKAMPFRGTTVLLAYNSAKVKNPPKTAEEIYQWIKAHPGRFAYNDPTTGGAGGAFGTTAIYNNLPAEALTSSDPKWKAQWNQGFALLKDLHSSMYKSSGRVQYPNKNQGTLDLLANGEIDMTPQWADMVLSQKQQKLLPDTIKLTQIFPAFTGSITSLVVPSISSHKEADYKFLNYVASPQAQAIFVEKQAAIPVIISIVLINKFNKYHDLNFAAALSAFMFCVCSFVDAIYIIYMSRDEKWVVSDR